jgi:cell division protein FtsB
MSENYKKYLNWVAERKAQNDWQNYFWGGGLNTSEMAREIGCNPRALTGQNSKISEHLAKLVEELTKKGILEASKSPLKGQTMSGAIRDKQLAKLRAENNSLMESNAQLRAKVMDLEAQAEYLGVLEDIIEETCRVPYDD